MIDCCGKSFLKSKWQKKNWFSDQNYINLDAIYYVLPFRKFEWDGNANWNQEMLLDEA